ncbi:TPA: hypothetical protein DEQ22_02100 [Candidatus Nomurabacteria bacterium]|uniref:Uncharacterized protein n=1 Tax=Candidatus Nomurabacteria bacterium RIFOXYA2_FULL_42_12 TaxID=1801801 RepID=A0A1F6YPJ9_9BACT|nr:MAG: hypothetical protein UV23_C0018G0009 [Candidatus Nomurabacteria bacterium GW2011_GWF1_42_40]KKT00462.1 MAG: hypothetical protein UV77_C0003G0008 [Candidatus Nomurabacteria bacterium GW2011_GWA1_43_17]KKT18013.1 MAG: hypothetical protein UW01_C0005G0008 [Candidatus Nomurabacteria bacterium GW2011_GWA2_43_66]OGJ05107.1 MAG: hypothetical protein A2357_00480 [Candidatus Nomurabacteria bacterium RIFOXYB1_FULL_43_14]OGJ08115.1 MAG: hypothetical protein A2183_02740 [Candidatus Nomurabacteria b
MGQIIFKIWYIIAILPFIMFLEGDEKLADYLKKKEIYAHWDVFHSLIVFLIILAFFLWLNGAR